MKVLDKRRENDKFFYDIEVSKEKFTNVEANYKCSSNWSDECEFCYECKWHKKGFIRLFDCYKNLDKVVDIANIITGIILGIEAFVIISVFNLGIIKSLLILIASIVILDIIFTLCIKYFIPNIWEKMFFRKLKNKQKKQDEIQLSKKKEQEDKKAKEDLEKSKKEPNYKKIICAESVLNNLKDITKEGFEGKNQETISYCIDKISKIVNALKTDSTKYSEVAFLFEVYLPEFYNLLKYYSEFVKTETVTKEHERILSNNVFNFMCFLNEQKVETIFDKEITETKFKSAAEALTKLVKKGE